MAQPQKKTSVVMIGSTYDTAAGDIVEVTAEAAERLKVNGHARDPRPGEVKAAEGK